MKPSGATARARTAARAARIRGRFRSTPPTRVAPLWEGSGSRSSRPSGRKAMSTQSSMSVNRSTMPASRAVISPNFSSARPQPSCLVLCTIASKRSTRSPLVYPFNVNSPKWTLKMVRFHRGRSITTACRGDSSAPGLRCGRPLAPNRVRSFGTSSRGPGAVDDGVEHPVHHRAGCEDQVAAVFDLVDRVAVAQAAARLLLAVEPEAQARGVDPGVDDLAQPPSRPGCGQGVCQPSQAFGVTDRGEAVALLGKAQAGRLPGAGEVFVTVEDHLRAERRMPTHLDRHMAPG